MPRHPELTVLIRGIQPAKNGLGYVPDFPTIVNVYHLYAAIAFQLQKVFLVKGSPTRFLSMSSRVGFEPSTFDYTSSVSPPTGRKLVTAQKVEPTKTNFSSFICHVLHLERRLRDSPVLLDAAAKLRGPSRPVGRGTSFQVKYTKWNADPSKPPIDVAIKEIISNDAQGDWANILLEVRALLHEPLRYHPNIVRLLGLEWGFSSETDHVFPMLILEYAPFGSMQKLQESMDPLAFPVKQKLCYDVARGLAALHACGIVHSDLKHENVLIFPNKIVRLDTVPYTAKLADFGGSIMDMTPGSWRKQRTITWPYQAPEESLQFSPEGLKQADVYSFGVLI